MMLTDGPTWVWIGMVAIVMLWLWFVASKG